MSRPIFSYFNFFPMLKTAMISIMIMATEDDGFERNVMKFGTLKLRMIVVSTVLTLI